MIDLDVVSNHFKLKFLHHNLAEYDFDDIAKSDTKMQL